MKIKIIEVSNQDNEDDIPLIEFGFKVGDVLEVKRLHKYGYASVQAIRDTGIIKSGELVFINESKYEIIEE